jgi:hypothetical protein
LTDFPIKYLKFRRILNFDSLKGRGLDSLEVVTIEVNGSITMRLDTVVLERWGRGSREGTIVVKGERDVLVPGRSYMRAAVASRVGYSALNLVAFPIQVGSLSEQDHQFKMSSILMITVVCSLKKAINVVRACSALFFRVYRIRLENDILLIGKM